MPAALASLYAPLAYSLFHVLRLALQRHTGFPEGPCRHCRPGCVAAWGKSWGHQAAALTLSARLSSLFGALPLRLEGMHKGAGGRLPSHCRLAMCAWPAILQSGLLLEAHN